MFICLQGAGQRARLLIILVLSIFCSATLAYADTIQAHPNYGFALPEPALPIGADAGPIVAVPPIIDEASLEGLLPSLGEAIDPADMTLPALVAALDHKEPQTDAAECLASTVYFEARGEPLAGQLAVAEVVLNRAEDGRFGDDVCDVVRKPYQFSFVRRGIIPDAPRSSLPWKRATAIAYIALNRMKSSPASRSLYFHAARVSPSWRHTQRRLARLGDHIFYQ